ncbi:MAG: hypothetical protein QOJ11_1657 [Frankiales bacterium]|nr:hypothetical protein [Frankiales bacterium]
MAPDQSALLELLEMMRHEETDTPGVQLGRDVGGGRFGHQLSGEHRRPDTGRLLHGIMDEIPCIQRETVLVGDFDTCELTSRNGRVSRGLHGRDEANAR